MKKITESHSDKGKETLRQMGTTPDQWILTPIKWVQEKRMIKEEVTCTTCDGHKQVLFEEPYKAIPWPVQPKDPYYHPDYQNFTQEELDSLHQEYKELKKVRDEYEKKIREKFPRYSDQGNCPDCNTKKYCGRDYRTGKMWGLVERLVWVGYPQWPQGVKFDSRFEYGIGPIKGFYRCALCAKSIFDLWSGLVPVCTREGVTPAHGMWVGKDCAKKFLALKPGTKKDHLLEIAFRNEK